jgi:hypothetical protein
LSVPDAGYSRNVPDAGYSRNVLDVGYSRNVLDVGYNKQQSTNTKKNKRLSSTNPSTNQVHLRCY